MLKSVFGGRDQPGEAPDLPALDDIHTVLVIGAGTIGLQIALQCAVHGYDVTLYDIQAPDMARLAEFAALTRSPSG